MKKEKMMILAIVVLGIAGGALAFKATKFTVHNLYFCTTTVPGCLAELYCTSAPYNTTSVGGTITTYPTSKLFTTISSIGPFSCLVCTNHLLGCPTYAHPTTAFINQ